ncbi:MAG: hypothetical protein IK127_03525 [Clostridia bacterium]|nr:hypothetical protein [Clostridia bacterium]
MKRIAALLLTLCLLLTAASALADVDLSYLEQYPDIFDVTQGEVLTFICDSMTAEDLSFVHAHESDYRYSYMYFELWIENGYDVIYPVLNIVYNADELLNITAVSFDLEGVRYTFSVDLDEPDRDEKGITEDPLIFFGIENVEFLSALEDIVDDCDTAEEMEEYRITAILHGDEDLTVTLSDAFLLDFYIVIKDAFIELGGLDNFDQIYIATPMTMEAIDSWDEWEPDEVEEDEPDDETAGGKDITDILREMFHK